MAALKLFKGDDTGGVFGRRLEFTITIATGIPVDGCHAEFIFDGIVKTFASPLVSGETREIVYTHEETARMSIGTRMATFRIIDANGRIRTLDNNVAVTVTDIVGQVYPGASSASVVIGTGITWEQIENKPLLVKTINTNPPDANGNINIAAGGTVKSATINGGAQIDPDPRGNLALVIPGATFDDNVTQSSSNGVKSSGIWSFVKGLLPNWLTSSYAEPATVASVNAKYTKPSGGIPSTDMTTDVQTALTNARTPTAHAEEHAHDGSDPITPAAIGAEASGAVSTHNGSSSAHQYLFEGKVSKSGDIINGDLILNSSGSSTTPLTIARNGSERSTVHLELDSGGSFYYPELRLFGGSGAMTKYYWNGIKWTPYGSAEVTLTLPSATGTLATTADIPAVVAPSTAASVAGKAADAKGTGDALAAKVGSFSAVGGQTPTVVSGVADLSSLFSSDNTSLASTIQTKIDETVGTINTALDAINGEVA